MTMTTKTTGRGGDERRGGEAERGELALQRRWAESRWPAPFLYRRAASARSEQDAGGVHGEPIRVITAGRWNHGPGPDFRGAQILDAAGRARRGDVELHLRPGGWRQHGHSGDDAYDGVLLHIVEHLGRTGAGGTDRGDPGAPQAVALPPADEAGAAGGSPAPPCAQIVSRAGRLAVEARLEHIAARRFDRKVRELQSLDPPAGPGEPRDRRALLAAARALGQPHNAERTMRGAADAMRGLDAASAWSELRLTIDAQGWRRGRGALGAPGGVAQVLETLIGRWSEAGRAPWTSVSWLAELPLDEALASLRIPRLLGTGRAAQLLADAVYPLTGARRRWLDLPAVRYQRSDDLRDRLGEQVRWRHPHSQALLELERTRCRHGACRICPLAALARG